jgi:hypothetical protein
MIIHNNQSPDVHDDLKDIDDEDSSDDLVPSDVVMAFFTKVFSLKICLFREQFFLFALFV